MKIDWGKVLYDAISNGFKVTMFTIFVILSVVLFTEAIILLLLWKMPDDVGIVGRALGLLLLTGIPLMRAIWRNKQ